MTPSIARHRESRRDQVVHPQTSMPSHQPPRTPPCPRGGSNVIQGSFCGGISAVQARFRGGLPARGMPSGVRQRRSALGLEAFPVDLRPRAGGQPLPVEVQAKMELALGSDFSDVRVHVGREAASVGAMAFTWGSDIHFAPGQYSPHTTYGQKLLGHELAHVVQQRAGRVRNPFGSGVAVVQDRALEAEADRMGMKAAMTPVRTLASSQNTPGETQAQAVQPRSVPGVGAIRRCFPPRVPATLAVQRQHNPRQIQRAVPRVRLAQRGGGTIQRAFRLDYPLYAFGNSSGPTAPREGVDLPVDPGDKTSVVPPTAEQLAALNVVGKSFFQDPRVGLTGAVYKSEGNAASNAKVDVIRDGKEAGGNQPLGHHTVYPAERMSVAAFTSAVANVANKKFAAIRKKKGKYEIKREVDESYAGFQPASTQAISAADAAPSGATDAQRWGITFSRWQGEQDSL